MSDWNGKSPLNASRTATRPTDSNVFSVLDDDSDTEQDQLLSPSRHQTADSPQLSRRSARPHDTTASRAIHSGPSVQRSPTVPVSPHDHSSPQTRSSFVSSRQPLLHPSFSAASPLNRPDTASKRGDEESVTIEMQSTGGQRATSRHRGRYADASGQVPPHRTFWDRLLCRPVPAAARTFNVGAVDEGAHAREYAHSFPPNIVRNQKYHVSTFLFVVLYNQVSRGQGLSET